MLLNQTSTAFACTKPLRFIGVCSQYLRYKVAIYHAIRHAKRQAFSSLRLLKSWTLSIWALIVWALTSCVMAGLMLYAGTPYAAEKELQQKPAVMPMDLIELLGELGDDEADLEVAMSSVKSNQAAKKSPQTETPAKSTTENSNTGAKK